MFVLPPPPRYPTHMYGGLYTGIQLMPVIETNNTLSHPSGPNCQFLVGEGLYVLEEDLLLATPPPHPSEAPVVNPNPLATTPLPATAGTKVSLVRIIDPPRPRALPLQPATAANQATQVDSAALDPAVAAGAEVTANESNGPVIAPNSTAEEHAAESESGGSAVGHAHQAESATGRLSINTTSAVSGGASDPALAVASPGTDTAPLPLASPSVATPVNSTTTTTLANLGLGNLGSLSTFGMGAKSATVKQRKPKNNVTKSNSSFISRVIVNDGIGKRLQERSAEGLLAFANINRAFQWLDLASDKKADYLTKILFTKAHCLCHDVNPVTKSTSHIDVIMGFSTGEIIWWEPISQRYTRLNKNGAIRDTPVSEIRWLPGSETLFMAAFMDGSLVLFDKEKEDAAFVPGAASAAGAAGAAGGSSPEDDDVRRSTQTRRGPSHIQVERSIHAGRAQKTNPVAFWKLSNQRINAFAFAPGGSSLLAVVSEDGSLRILDYVREELVGLYYAYYGGLTCVCWSPDGKYVVTGGQDDLLSIWSVADAALAARCQGHHSWVTSVAFDPWRCDGRNYRFGSVAEDCRLCLWDFSISMLIRPKAGPLHHRGGSVSAASRRTMRRRGASDVKSIGEAGKGVETNGNGTGTGAAAGKATGTGDLAARPDTDDTAAAEDELDDVDERVHAVEPRARIALLPPVCSQVVDKGPLSWLDFTEKSIIISSKAGHIRTWTRPADNTTQAGEGAS